jgi:hypothetical protein
MIPLNDPSRVAIFDNFNTFNFLNFDTFDSAQSSLENSATYGFVGLAQVLPLFRR